MSVKVPPTSTAATLVEDTAIALTCDHHRDEARVSVRSHQLHRTLARIAVATSAGVAQYKTIARAHAVAAFEPIAVAASVPLDDRRAPGSTPEHSTRRMRPPLDEERER